MIIEKNNHENRRDNRRLEFQVEREIQIREKPIIIIRVVL